MTFQAVADAVGVTKGGVMHHFATKNALILEVFHDAMAKFEAEVNQAMAQDPVRYGSFTRAYIDATISLGEKGQEEFDNQATLYVLMLGDSELRELWAAWSNEQLINYEVGEALTQHPDIAKVSFTGGVPTGKKVMSSAASSSLKDVTLELGGKSPLIIFEDADIDTAADIAMMANFYSSGQVCTNGTRVFIPKALQAKLINTVNAPYKNS